MTELKRQCRRVTSDLQDAQVLTDSLQGRMHELDRKQRRCCHLSSRHLSSCVVAPPLHQPAAALAVSRFDSELTQALEEAAGERELKDKTVQENTVLGAEIFSLRRSVQVTLHL